MIGVEIMSVTLDVSEELAKEIAKNPNFAIAVLFEAYSEVEAIRNALREGDADGLAGRETSLEFYTSEVEARITTRKAVMAKAAA